MQIFPCPKCGKNLIGTAVTCQFCGADVSKAVRPVDTSNRKAKIEAFETPRWIWVLYYLVGTWWVIGNLIDMLSIVAAKQQAAKNPTLFDNGSWGLVDLFYFLFPIAGLLLGLGLLLKWSFMRKVVNLICGLKILSGIMNVLGSVALIAVLGPLGLLFMFAAVLNIIVAGGTIWLLSETADNLWDD